MAQLLLPTPLMHDAGDDLLPGTPSEPGAILLIDDDDRNLAAVELALEDIADRVVKARSGREAFRRLLEADFALILLDVQMPRMDGFETARMIRHRERSRFIPIIFITAYDRSDRDVLAAYQLGAVDFLQKPIVPEILRAKASVFVTLGQRTAQVARQAALLREHERQEHERRLLAAKRIWEAQELERRAEEEHKNAEAMAHKAAELARTVSELERAELELTRINAQLAQADQRKDEFLAVLSHELRNPMAALTCGLDLLRSHSIDDPLVVRVRDAMDRQIQSLCRLVDDLLDVTRITSGKIELKRQQLDLAEIVRQSASSDQNGAERTIEVDVPDDGLVCVHGDPVRLRQIVANLVSNAIRYTGRDGHIRISLRAEDGEARLEVADNGRGIPADLLERVFDRFFQAENGNDGLGIGLTLVQRLVELHGGRVEADSPGPGEGSTFTVSLPLSADMPRVTDREPKRPSSRGRALRIVVIEDNADIRDMLSTFLTQLGHRVEVSSNGPDGLELLLRIQPDVALVDIGLPGLDGYGIAERVRVAFPDAAPRLIAMTGYGQERDRDRARQAGFHDYLTKPASIDTLMRAIQG